MQLSHPSAINDISIRKSCFIPTFFRWHDFQWTSVHQIVRTNLQQNSRLCILHHVHLHPVLLRGTLCTWLVWLHDQYRLTNFSPFPACFRILNFSSHLMIKLFIIGWSEGWYYIIVFFHRLKNSFIVSLVIIYFFSFCILFSPSGGHSPGPGTDYQGIQDICNTSPFPFPSVVIASCISG